MLMLTQRTSFPLIFTVLCVALLSLKPADAAKKPMVETTITVGEMCGGCVKRITAVLEKKKEVAKFKCDIKTKTVTLFPAKSVRFQPKELWETMESIGKKPQKLVGPDGTFTSKPK